MPKLALQTRTAATLRSPFATTDLLLFYAIEEIGSRRLTLGVSVNTSIDETQPTILNDGGLAIPPKSS